MMRRGVAIALLAGMACGSFCVGQAAKQAGDAVQGISAPTWSHDIAPIVYGNCTTCHHAGGAGPFSLMSYAEARRWAPQIAKVTVSRFMPPWLPEPGYGDFADNRRLSDHDVDLLQSWIRNGMPEGKPLNAPAPPHYEAMWQLGKPDLILRVQYPYTLKAAGSDVFRNFVLPYPLKQTHYVRAMQIIPGVPQIVHHANVIIDRTESLRHQHPKDWQFGVPGMELLVDAGNRFDPDSHFLFWKPDSPVLTEPADMAWRLDPGNDLILNMHLKPSGKAETLDAQVGIYFTDEAPSKHPMLLQLDRDDALNIPPGDAHFVVEDELALPVDVDVLGVYPHAHYLGRDMQGWATLPDEKKEWLVWIKNWDIDRQSVYHYKEPLFLPKGTVLHMRYTYDNSSDNVHNPNAPPVEVKAGNRSVDEMSHLWLQVLPVHVAPNAPDPRLLLEEAWMRNRLSKTPDDHVGLYNLASALAGQGEFSKAVATYEQALRLTPNDAGTLIALGSAEEGAGDWKQAEASYRKAMGIEHGGARACDAEFDLATVELRHEELNSAQADFEAQIKTCPGDAAAHAGLGDVYSMENRIEAAQSEFHRSLALDAHNLAALTGLGESESNAGQAAEAIKHLSEAIQVDPSSTEAHEQLARAYAQTGALDKALAEMQTTAKLKPDDPEVHSALSQLLVALGKLDEAIVEQQAALKILDDDPDGWNNLGVMEARSGKVGEARADFEHALKLQPDHAQAKANLERLQGQN